MKFLVFLLHRGMEQWQVPVLYAIGNFLSRMPHLWTDKQFVTITHTVLDFSGNMHESLRAAADFVMRSLMDNAPSTMLGNCKEVFNFIRHPAELTKKQATKEEIKNTDRFPGASLKEGQEVHDLMLLRLTHHSLTLHKMTNDGRNQVFNYRDETSGEAKRERNASGEWPKKSKMKGSGEYGTRSDKSKKGSGDYGKKGSGEYERERLSGNMPRLAVEKCGSRGSPKSSPSRGTPRTTSSPRPRSSQGNGSEGYESYESEYTGSDEYTDGSDEESYESGEYEEEYDDDEYTDEEDEEGDEESCTESGRESESATEGELGEGLGDEYSDDDGAESDDDTVVFHGEQTAPMIDTEPPKARPEGIAVDTHSLPRSHGNPTPNAQSTTSISPKSPKSSNSYNCNAAADVAQQPEVRNWCSIVSVQISVDRSASSDVPDFEMYFDS